MPRGKLAGGSAVLLAIFGVGCAASLVWFGLYDLSLWGPVTLVLVVVLVALAPARPALPRGALAIACVALAGLWLWAWLSRVWGEARADTLVAADRWLLYAAAFAVLALLLRSAGHARVLLVAATVGVLGVAGYLLIVMLVGDGRTLFHGGRLNNPLGYVNAQAAFLLLGVWPAVALAESGRRMWAPVGVAAATLLTALAVLGQARGVALAGVVSVAVVLIVVPGRMRRLWILVVVAAGIALALEALLDVYRSAGPAAPTEAAIHHAAVWAMLSALVAGCAWAVLDALVAAGLRDLRTRDAVHQGGRALTGLVALAALVLGAAFAPSIARAVRDQAHVFTHLGAQPPGDSRLLSGGGNRYDYWRVAVREFAAHPVKGVGAGNYPAGWFARRSVAEDIRQPHSIELQTLSELGIVGGVLLALFLGAVLIGFGRMAREGAREPAERGLAVAAGGTFVVWLAATSVDWLHLLPGPTGIALAAAAVLLVPWRRLDRSRRTGPAAIVGLGALVVLVGFGAWGVVRPVLAQHERSQARAVLDQDPRRALRLVNGALRLDGDVMTSYYVKASAYARLGDYRDARETLLQAAARQPHTFVTWVLLGDLASRRGDRRAARRAYRRASSLDPADGGLRQLAAATY